MSLLITLLFINKTYTNLFFRQFVQANIFLKLQEERCLSAFFQNLRYQRVSCFNEILIKVDFEVLYLTGCDALQ